MRVSCATRSSVASFLTIVRKPELYRNPPQTTVVACTTTPDSPSTRESQQPATTMSRRRWLQQGRFRVLDSCDTWAT